MTVIESNACRIDPLGAWDIRHYKQLTTEIYQLLTDEHTLQFLPEKQLNSLPDAESWLNAAILNFHSGRNKVHLIRSKKNWFFDRRDRPDPADCSNGVLPAG